MLLSLKKSQGTTLHVRKFSSTQDQFFGQKFKLILTAAWQNLGNEMDAVQDSAGKKEHLRLFLLPPRSTQQKMFPVLAKAKRKCLLDMKEFLPSCINHTAWRRKSRNLSNGTVTSISEFTTGNVTQPFLQNAKKWQRWTEPHSHFSAKLEFTVRARSHQ